jgi:hypothetical protein
MIAPPSIADGILFRAGQITRYYPDQIAKPTRVREIVRVRQAVMYAMHKRTSLSYLQIAQKVGLTDHTTTMHTVRLVPELIERDEEYAAFVRELLTAPAVPMWCAAKLLRDIGVKPRRAPDPVETPQRRARRVATARAARLALKMAA